MKKKKNAVILSLALAAFILVFSVFTVMAYSTDDDPLVTLSYLNEVVIPKLKSELGGSSTAETPAPSQPETPATEDNSQAVVSQNSYTLLELKVGQTVKAKSAVEIIVRPGSIVTAVSPFPTQGIADITNGNEILDGEEIAINAYCIIPRGDDDRGFYVHSENAYVMIRGEYEIG